MLLESCSSIEFPRESERTRLLSRRDVMRTRGSWLPAAWATRAASLGARAWRLRRRVYASSLYPQESYRSVDVESKRPIEESPTNCRHAEAAAPPLRHDDLCVTDSRSALSLRFSDYSR